MAAPIIVAIAEVVVIAVVEWIKRLAILEAIATFIEEVLEPVVDELKELLSVQINEAIVEAIQTELGLEVDPEDPLAEHSLVFALNTLLETDRLTTLKDKDVLLQELMGLAFDKIYEQTGILFPEDPLNGEEWFEVFAMQMTAAAGEDGESTVQQYVCPAIEIITEALCVSSKCHWCMEGGKDECEEARKNDRARPKKCKR
jgi:hypothetical protein